MACVQPFEIPNPLYGASRYIFRGWKKYLRVPCGWCLNCRVDKRNFLCDVCEHLQKVYGYCSFVTFTYDEAHLHTNLFPAFDCDTVRSFKAYEWYLKNRCYVRARDSVHSGCFSLSRLDAKRLRYRIRSFVNRLPDTPLTRHDYKFVLVGEYGDLFQRPHLHGLFFGLDYTQEFIFSKCWKFGLVECDPILNGGIRYVCDYIDKQLHSSLAREIYDDCGLERPFLTHSLGFANDFVLSRLDELRSNYGCYFIENRKLRPLQFYYARKYDLIFSPRPRAFDERFKSMYGDSCYDSNGIFSLKKYNSMRSRASRVRFEHLRNMCRRKQLAVDDLVSETVSPYDDSLSCKASEFLNIELKIYGDVVPF